MGTAGADMLASRVVASTVYRWKVEEEEDPVCVLLEVDEEGEEEGKEVSEEGEEVSEEVSD